MRSETDRREDVESRLRAVRGYLAAGEYFYGNGDIERSRVFYDDGVRDLQCVTETYADLIKYGDGTLTVLGSSTQSLQSQLEDAIASIQREASPVIREAEELLNQISEVRV